MKINKIQLEALRVSSFVTTISEHASRTAKGGDFVPSNGDREATTATPGNFPPKPTDLTSWADSIDRCYDTMGQVTQSCCGSAHC